MFAPTTEGLKIASDEQLAAAALLRVLYAVADEIAPVNNKPLAKTFRTMMMYGGFATRRWHLYKESNKQTYADAY